MSCRVKIDDERSVRFFLVQQEKIRKFTRYLVLLAPFLSIAFPIQLAAEEILILGNESIDASGVKLFYRGDYDGETVTASNGANVNKGYTMLGNS